MEEVFFSYLSLYEDGEEQKYIMGLIDQFQKSTESELYHLALFAYHLLFLCYFYQILYKIKIWMPNEYHAAMVSFNEEKRKKFREALSPVDFVHETNKERSIFEFLNILCDCNDTVSSCKKLVDYRNKRLGHVNYLLVSEDAFNYQIEKYNKAVSDVNLLTNKVLLRIFNEYLKEIDKTIEQTKNELEIQLVSPNKLSEEDVKFLILKNQKVRGKEKKEIIKILKEDFNVNV
jgi:hypothetical protein